jgi:hypothetical protein
VAPVVELMEEQDNSTLRLGEEQAAEVRRRLADESAKTVTLAEFNERLRGRLRQPGICQPVAVAGAQRQQAIARYNPFQGNRTVGLGRDLRAAVMVTRLSHARRRQPLALLRDLHAAADHD